MFLFNEYALLVAVATPVVVMVGLNVYLAMREETGALLLPSLRAFPSIEIEKSVEAAPAPVATSTATAPANEERMLEAA